MVRVRGYGFKFALGAEVSREFVQLNPLNTSINLPFLKVLKMWAGEGKFVEVGQELLVRNL